MSVGFFITFEGLDGSGKSTQLRLLTETLRARGEPVVATRQPGGTAIGERIRSLLLSSRTESLSPMSELGLMFSDRAQAIQEVILPALTSGKIVLCDRFTDSTEAYQGGGRQIGSAVVLNLHANLCSGLQPDLTILLLPDFDLSLERARRRNQRTSKQEMANDENRFEREKDGFYRRVFDKYKEIAARDFNRVAVFDGDHSIGEIHRRIVQTVEKRLTRVS